MGGARGRGGGEPGGTGVGGAQGGAAGRGWSGMGVTGGEGDPVGGSRWRRAGPGAPEACGGRVPQTGGVRQAWGVGGLGHGLTEGPAGAVGRQKGVGCYGIGKGGRLGTLECLRRDGAAVGGAGPCWGRWWLGRGWEGRPNCAGAGNYGGGGWEGLRKWGLEPGSSRQVRAGEGMRPACLMAVPHSSELGAWGTEGLIVCSGGLGQGRGCGLWWDLSHS